jgi:hypothetical protein
MIKSIIVVFLAFAMLVYGSFKLYDKGLEDGLQSYHKQCYEVGGMIFNETDGTVVRCAPLVVLPQEERPMFKGA